MEGSAALSPLTRELTPSWILPSRGGILGRAKLLRKRGGVELEVYTPVISRSPVQKVFGVTPSLEGAPQERLLFKGGETVGLRVASVPQSRSSSLEGKVRKPSKGLTMARPQSGGDEKVP